MAFSTLPREMGVDWQNITFSSSMEIESFSGTNYAFCKVRETNLVESTLC